METRLFRSSYFRLVTGALIIFLTVAFPYEAYPQIGRCIDLLSKQVNPQAHSSKVVISARTLSPEAQYNDLILDPVDSVNSNVAERFLANPKFDGTAPIPANLSMEITISEPVYDRRYSTRFVTGSVKAQIRDYRRLFNDLKRRALNHSTEGEVEFGMMVVEYADQTTESKVFRFTSDAPHSIRAPDFQKALDGSLAFKSGKPVERVTFIHTHPARHSGNISPITPSASDFLVLKQLETQIFWGPNGQDFVGIVLPNSPQTQDSFFEFRSDGLTWLN